MVGRGWVGELIEPRARRAGRARGSCEIRNARPVPGVPSVIEKSRDECRFEH
jgi:hypothetical protein